MDAIVTYDLSKQYGSTPALCGLNLQVPEGTAFACVGRENSGKTTVIRLLSGLCRPTMGECEVLGLSPFFEPEKLHAVVGTVLDTARLYERMTVSENLRFFAGLNGVDENDALDRLSFLLHKLDIWESRDGRVDDLPTGVVFRASLARALMHSPRVLLLDDPSDGLDRETGDSVRELVSHLVCQEGVTVLLCTENMEYAQSLCGGFALLQNGTLLAKGDMEGLRRGAGVRCRAVLRLEEGASPPKGFRRNGAVWVKAIASEQEMPKTISQAVSEVRKLYEARFEEPTLEEIYAAFLEGGIQRAGVLDEQDDEYDEDGEEAAAIPEEEGAPETAAAGGASPEDGDWQRQEEHPGGEEQA